MTDSQTSTPERAEPCPWCGSPCTVRIEWVEQSTEGGTEVVPKTVRPATCQSCGNPVEVLLTRELLAWKLRRVAIAEALVLVAVAGVAWLVTNDATPALVAAIVVGSVVFLPVVVLVLMSQRGLPADTVARARRGGGAG